MIFYFTEHVMGWGGVGIIPNRSVAPLVDVHTGTIDNVWHMVKQSLPNSLRTNDAKKPQQMNKKNWQYVRAWQRRWENAAASAHELSRMTAATYAS